MSISLATTCEICGYEHRWVWVSKNARGRLLCDSCAMIEEYEFKEKTMNLQIGQVWELKKEKQNNYSVNTFTIVDIRVFNDEVYFTSIECNSEYSIQLLKDKYNHVATLEREEVLCLI